MGDDSIEDLWTCSGVYGDALGTGLRGDIIGLDYITATHQPYRAKQLARWTRPEGSLLTGSISGSCLLRVCLTPLKDALRHWKFGHIDSSSCGIVPISTNQYRWADHASRMLKITCKQNASTKFTAFGPQAS